MNDLLQPARFWIIGLCLVLASNLTGCVGYQLGSMLPPDIRTVHVPTCLNETDEPLLEVDVTRAVIREIQRDGSLRIAGADEADAILEITLTGFRLSPVAYEREIRGRADEYRMIITANLLMTRSPEGDVIVEAHRVSGDTVFPLVGDMTSAKLTAIPDASEDLGRQIVNHMVETWPTPQ